MTTRTWTIQMHWLCKHCGTRCPGMSGEERESLRCTHCGAEKTDEEWLMPDSPETAPALTGELDQKARAGANWTCTYCKAESRAGAKRCEVCGAERSVEVASASVIVRRTPVPEEAVRSDGPYRAPPTPAPWPRLVVDEERALPVTPWWKAVFPVVGAVLAIVLVTVFFGWLFTPNEAVAVVAKMTWSRERRLEERHAYEGEGWRKNAPSGVFSWDHCETRQSGMENCHPHRCRCHDVSYSCRCTGGTSYSCNCRRSCSTRCSSNRNGAATCSESCSTSCATCTTPRVCSTCSRTECDTCYDQCPVYEDWCRYRYHQWDELRRLRTAGEGTVCVWPALDATTPLQRLHSEEHYTVRFDDTRSDRRWVRTYDDYARYARFETGQRWRIEWTRAGGFNLKGRAP